jgi:hypothetical protein
MSWFIIVLNIFEALACITGFLYWKKIRNSYWYLFPVYLAIIVLTELTGEYLLHVKKDLDVNIALYRYFGVPVQFFFFYWLFYQYFKSTKRNKWPLYSAAIYLASWLTDLVYLSSFKLYFDSFSYAVGCILLLVLLLIYFTRFIKSDELLHYKSSMMFWVCMGIFIFYIGSLPFWGLRTTLYRQYPDFFYTYWYTQYGLNYLMYILFSVSFIWGKPK